MGQSKVLYAIGRVVCTPIFKLFYRYKPINNHTIPEKGGFIVASNNLSFSDPVLLGLCQKRIMAEIKKMREQDLREYKKG